jgi:hypothetical protein
VSHLQADPIVQHFGRLTRSAIPGQAVLHHRSELILEHQDTLRKKIKSYQGVS